MSRRVVSDLGTAVVRFFEDHLPAQRGMSQHTVRSYRDAVVLLLRFTAKERARGIEALELADLTVDRIERFLKHLEIERRNGVATRNARLAAIHTLARFLTGAIQSGSRSGRPSSQSRSSAARRGCRPTTLKPRA